MLPHRPPVAEHAEVFLQNGVKGPSKRVRKSGFNTMISGSGSRSAVEFSGVDNVRKVLEKLAKEIARGDIQNRLSKVKNAHIRGSKAALINAETKKEKHRTEDSKSKGKEGSHMAKLIIQSGKGVKDVVSQRVPSGNKSKELNLLKSFITARTKEPRNTATHLGSSKVKDIPVAAKVPRATSRSKDNLEKRKLRKVVSQCIPTDKKSKPIPKQVAKKTRREPLSMDQFRPAQTMKSQHSFKQSQHTLATDEKLYLNTSTTSMYGKEVQPLKTQTKFPRTPKSPLAHSSFTISYPQLSKPALGGGATQPRTSKHPAQSSLSPLPAPTSVPTVRLPMPHTFPSAKQTDFVCRLTEEERTLWVDDYISTGFQPSLRHKMRIILVDWLSAVAHDLGLVRDNRRG